MSTSGEELSHAEEVIRDLDGFDPDAVKLAHFASLAARIEPELLRALRVGLLPSADAAAEAHLWFSDLVMSRGPEAMVLAPEVADWLRSHLPPELAGALSEARRVIEAIHEPLPKLLAIEEELIWLAVTGGDPKKIERILSEISVEMAKDSERSRPLASWAIRAVPRLPAGALETPAAWMLALGAGARLKTKPVLKGRPPAGLVEGFFAGVLGKIERDVKVAVKRARDALELTLGGEDIAIPDVAPHVVEISWDAGKGREVVALEPGTPVERKVPGLKDVLLRTIDGREYVVRAGWGRTRDKQERAKSRGQPPAQEAVEGTETAQGEPVEERIADATFAARSDRSGFYLSSEQAIVPLDASEGLRIIAVAESDRLALVQVSPEHLGTTLAIGEACRIGDPWRLWDGERVIQGVVLRGDAETEHELLLRSDVNSMGLRAAGAPVLARSGVVGVMMRRRADGIFEASSLRRIRESLPEELRGPDRERPVDPFEVVDRWTGLVGGDKPIARALCIDAQLAVGTGRASSGFLRTQLLVDGVMREAEAVHATGDLALLAFRPPLPEAPPLEFAEPSVGDRWIARADEIPMLGTITAEGPHAFNLEPPRMRRLDYDDRKEGTPILVGRRVVGLMTFFDGQLLAVPMSKAFLLRDGYLRGQQTQEQVYDPSQANGRLLTANVFDKRIRLEVRSIDSSRPLRGFVTFHVRDGAHRVRAADGLAHYMFELTGPSIVAAECDDGRTRLELDLATLPIFSEKA